MEKKSENFSELSNLAQSQAGQQLLALLRQTDPAALERAKQNAQAGNYTEAARALSAFLSSPEAQALMKQLGG